MSLSQLSNLACITLTGADERTDIDALVRLANNFPQVELGLLYTATPEGRPRYPSRAWLVRAATALSGRVAIHVCGGAARRELLEGGLADLTVHAPRVQVNGPVSVEMAEQAASLVGNLITQHNTYPNSHELLKVRARNHSLLVDASGGRGLSPLAWEAPETDKPVGFAGGLGADNLRAEYGRIGDVCKPGAWTDMEGKLRVDDWFSLELAADCATKHAVLTSRSLPRMTPGGDLRWTA